MQKNIWQNAKRWYQQQQLSTHLKFQQHAADNWRFIKIWLEYLESLARCDAIWYPRGTREVPERKAYPGGAMRHIRGSRAAPRPRALSLCWHLHIICQSTGDEMPPRPALHRHAWPTHLPTQIFRCRDGQTYPYCVMETLVHLKLRLSRRHLAPTQLSPAYR